jgi:hypothetical protein
MVGGAAYYAGRKVAQGDQRESEQQARLEALEAQQYSQQQYPPPQQYPPQQQYSPPPPPPPQAPPASQKSVTEELTALKSLLDAGVLTQAEFDVQKAKILNL